MAESTTRPGGMSPNYTCGYTFWSKHDFIVPKKQMKIKNLNRNCVESFVILFNVR